MEQRLIVMALLLMLGGCASAGNCAGWSQINPSRTDKLTAGTSQQILAHNRFGATQGCWSSR